MELRDHTIAVLRRHGITRMSQSALYMVELVDVYVLDSVDLLMSKMFRDVAQRNGVEVAYLFRQLRRMAMRIKRKDLAWYDSAFPECYTSPVFVQAVARESLDSLQTWGG